MSHSETAIESNSIRLQKSPKRRTTDSRIDTRCLNALKFFAACMIAFVWHYQHFKPQNGSPFASIFKFGYKEGWLMVELFFALSGFGMFLGYAEKIRKRQISFGEYILKRLKKLYPIFFLTLLLVTGLELWHRHLAGKNFVYVVVHKHMLYTLHYPLCGYVLHAKEELCALRLHTAYVYRTNYCQD